MEEIKTEWTSVGREHFMRVGTRMVYTITTHGELMEYGKTTVLKQAVQDEIGNLKVYAEWLYAHSKTPPSL